MQNTVYQRTGRDRTTEGAGLKEYIERSAVKDEILSWAVCINHPELLSKEDTMHCVDSLPAADVVEVRHGRWIFEPGKIPYCSECKEYSDDGDKGATFCPWCGARIDKEDEQ